jgi:hypothetical protein
MPRTSPEEHYRKGRLALSSRKPREAATHFQKAIEREREIGVLRPQMRYLSFLGLSMAAGHKPDHRAVACCEHAATTEPNDPELLLNLGRVYYLAGLPTRSLAAIERGLRVEPDHAGLLGLRRKVDRRTRPFLPSLGRDHPLNRSLGRLRAALFPRRRAADDPDRPTAT